MNDVYYFGAWGGPGHHIWRSSDFDWSDKYPGPWTRRELDGLDGCLMAPVDPQEKEGVWKLSSREGRGGLWTAIGCWDRSQDQRMGSVSVFVVPGRYGLIGMFGIACVAFPDVWRRIRKHCGNSLATVVVSE